MLLSDFNIIHELLINEGYDELEKKGIRSNFDTVY